MTSGAGAEGGREVRLSEVLAHVAGWPKTGKGAARLEGAALEWFADQARDESLEMALRDLERAEVRLAAIASLLADLDRGNGLSRGGVSCGVCSGHSPSWDGHSRNCLTALPDRLRAALAGEGAL